MIDVILMISMSICSIAWAYVICSIAKQHKNLDDQRIWITHRKIRLFKVTYTFDDFKTENVYVVDDTDDPDLIIVKANMKKKNQKESTRIEIHVIKELDGYPVIFLGKR